MVLQQFPGDADALKTPLRGHPGLAPATREFHVERWRQVAFIRSPNCIDERLRLSRRGRARPVFPVDFRIGKTQKQVCAAYDSRAFDFGPLSGKRRVFKCSPVCFKDRKANWASALAFTQSRILFRRGRRYRVRETGERFHAEPEARLELPLRT